MSKKQSPRRRQRLFLQTGNILPEGYTLQDTYRSSGRGWPRLLLQYGLGIALFLLAGWLFLNPVRDKALLERWLYFWLLEREVSVYEEKNDDAPED